MALAPTSRKANNVARISAIVIFVFCSVTVACQEILTEKLAFGQETLIKTLLQQKQPSIKQGKRFGANKKKNIGTNIHLGNVVLSFRWRALY
jgi:hypothetical protein